MLLLVTAMAHAGDHGHSHSEDGEKASFKYSREANFVEDEIMEDDIVDLPPQYSNEKPGKNEATTSLLNKQPRPRKSSIPT